MNFKPLALAGALSCALVAPPAVADPLVDALDALFSPAREARLHPSAHGWRRIRAAPLRAESGAMLASYYGGGEYLNRRTASGARFDPRALTAAHRSLPFGTRLRVSHGGRAVVVTVNDRGPAAWTGRSLDLSSAAASALGMIGAGVAAVRVRIVD